MKQLYLFGEGEATLGSGLASRVAREAHLSSSYISPSGEVVLDLDLSERTRRTETEDRYEPDLFDGSEEGGELVPG